MSLIDRHGRYIDEGNAVLSALLKASDDLMADMRRRAKMRRDVDDDGYVVLDCGNSVLFSISDARDKARAFLVTRPTSLPDTSALACHVEAIMEQAQVFASAWSLVGGKFDSGQMLQDAEVAKAELRSMLLLLMPEKSLLEGKTGA